MVWTEIIVSFLRFHSRTEFQINLLTMRATPFLQWVLAHSSGYNGDSLWWMLSDLWFPKERILLEDQGLSFSHSELCVVKDLLQWKRNRENFWQTSEGSRECPTHEAYQGLIYFFNWLLKIERSSQTYCHKIHLKITGLDRSFLLGRRNMSSGKKHCCYIIISTEPKEKHTLEQDEILCNHQLWD